MLLIDQPATDSVLNLSLLVESSHELANNTADMTD
jgi:hypothetical protein